MTSDNIENPADNIESYCPQCGSTVTEIDQGERLRCDYSGCGHVFDNKDYDNG